MVFCDFFLDFCRLTDCLNCHLVFSDMKGFWWGDEGDKRSYYIPALLFGTANSREIPRIGAHKLIYS